MNPITFTLDLEASPSARTEPHRLADASARILSLLGERGVRGTIFVVGELARAQPRLVRDALAAGHEIGLHGYRHVPLTELDPAVFAEHVRRGKALLEDLTQQPVDGFRAPYFSLVATTPWAPELLAEAGFSYSSSVLPGSSPQYGFPECPDTPFRWPSGLIELPVPVIRIGRRAVPFLGGIYLRLLPPPIVHWALRRARNSALWTYCHPYDFDPEEPFEVVPRLGWAKSRLLWANRRTMLAKVGRLLERAPGEPLGTRLRRGAIVVPDLVPDPR